MKTTWGEIHDAPLNQLMRQALERLRESGGEGFVSHSTAQALARRGLVTLSAASPAPSHSWVAPQFHATLTAKGRAAL
jgi:hypothetical protein